MAKIAGEVEKRIIELSPTSSNGQIAEQIKTEFDVSISAEAIRKYLKTIRQDRAETTKALVQETIKATVPRDLEILDEQILQMDEWRRDDSLKISDRLQVIKEQRTTIAEKLKHSGANEQADGNTFVCTWVKPNG